MAETKDKLVTLEQLKLAKDSIAIPGIATTEIVGIVKPDGTTVTIDEDGTIHSSSIKIADYETASEIIGF